MFIRCTLVFAWFLVLACAAGCGSSTAEVSGTITINGQPLHARGLEIVFLSRDGRLFSGEVAEDGTYQVAGVPCGDTSVGLTFSPPELAGQGRRGRGPLEGRGPPEVITRSPVPEGLRDPSTSRLTVHVSGTKTIFDYNVTP
jgi:hypothetical protein